KFPGEICGIAQTRTHALPGKRRRLMCRVAGKQNAALSPLPGDPCPECVNRFAFDPDSALDIPWREQLFDKCIIADLVASLSGEDHELPAMAPLAHEHTGRRALGIADLEVCRRQPGI